MAQCIYRDAIGRIECLGQKTHDTILSHIRDQEIRLSTLQQQADTQTALLSDLPKFSNGVSNLYRLEDQIPKALLRYSQSSQAGFDGIHTRLNDHQGLLSELPAIAKQVKQLPDIKIQGQQTQQLLLTNAQSYRADLNKIEDRMDTQMALISGLPSLPADVAALTNQVATYDRNATFNAVRQAQCILTVKDEILDMNRTLLQNTEKLNSIERARTNLSSQPQSIIVSPNAIDVFVESMRLMGQALFKWYMCLLCTGSYNVLTSMI